MENSDEGICHFQWSFQPLTFCLKFLGIPFNFSDKKTPRKALVFVPLLCCCIILANFIINSPRVFEPGCLNWMKEIDNFESPFTYFKANPFGIIRLLKLISNMIFFCYVPFLHLTFVIMVLFGNDWGENMMFILQKIQQYIKPSKEFHRKLRKRCFVAMLLLAVVFITTDCIRKLQESIRLGLSICRTNQSIFWLFPFDHHRPRFCHLHNGLCKYIATSGS